MDGWGTAFLVLLFLVVLPAGGWAGYTRYRAHKQGLPPPPLSAYIPFKRSRQSNYGSRSRSSGPLGWIKGKISGLRKGSGYAGTTRGSRGFGPLDPDAAWDDRVGAEAVGHGHIDDYEEQELGLHPPPGAYGGNGYGGHTTLPEYGQESFQRGRSRSRDDSYVGGNHHGLDQRYDEEMDRTNPFGQNAERSDLKAVSPRPLELDAGRGHAIHGRDINDAGASHPYRQDRRSHFHEAM